MNKGYAMFIEDAGHYLPANKNAVAVCAILSSRRLKPYMMEKVRGLGYVPMLANGEELGRLDLRA